MTKATLARLAYIRTPSSKELSEICLSLTGSDLDIIIKLTPEQLKNIARDSVKALCSSHF